MAIEKICLISKKFPKETKKQYKKKIIEKEQIIKSPTRDII